MNTPDNTRGAEIAALLVRLAELLSAPPITAPVARRPMPERVMLTVEEAAERLRIGRTRMFALVKAGAIESVRIGRLRRIPVSAIEAYAVHLIADHSVA